MWDNTDRQKALVRRDFDTISQWAQENKRDVILGEFGVTNYADIDSQVNWTRFIREEAESRGMIWIFWQLFYDDGNGDTLLIRALADEQWQVRRLATRALLVNGPVSQPAVPALMDAFDDEEWQVRKMVVLALSCIVPDDASVQAALQASLDDPEAHVRRVAENSLRTLNDEH